MEDVDEMPYETNPSDLLLLRKIVDDAPQLNRLLRHKKLAQAPPTSLPPTETFTGISLAIISTAFAEK